MEGLTNHFHNINFRCVTYEYLFGFILCNVIFLVTLHQKYILTTIIQDIPTDLKYNRSFGK